MGLDGVVLDIVETADAYAAGAAVSVSEMVVSMVNVNGTVLVVAKDW